MTEGKTVKWEWGKGSIDYDQFPSYVISQLIGIQPIQIQNFVGWSAGEIDGLDALARSAGLPITSVKPKKKRSSGKIKGLPSLKLGKIKGL